MVCNSGGGAIAFFWSISFPLFYLQSYTGQLLDLMGREWKHGPFLCCKISTCPLVVVFPVPPTHLSSYGQLVADAFVNWDVVGLKFHSVRISGW